MNAEAAWFSSLPHRRILVGIYIAIATILVAEIIYFWNDARGALVDYLSGGGLAGIAAIAIAYSTPLSCALIAWLVYRQSRSYWLFLPVAHTLFTFTTAILPAVYLLWWYWHLGVEHVDDQNG